ncbi:MAG: carbamoyltransferase [Bacteroidales bacterium]|jgi:carbamoyltransferase|nr:carbamoyltransferase [Bacteroidales bacterium]
MNILGISAYYHDSSACVIKDGVLTAAVQEERFNRIKNCSDFPIQAINFCVQQSGISFSDIDYVAYYEQPYIKFNRILLDYIEKFPFSYLPFLKNIPYWLQDRLILPITIKKELGYTGKIFFVPHHYSHAASTFFLSPFEEAGIITADGVGEFATTCTGTGKLNTININQQINYPHSLGLLYSAFTTYLGFKANSGEGTTMALASFGNPDFVEPFKELINIADDGSYKLNLKYFSYNTGKKMYSRRLEKLLGKPRMQNEEITDRHKAIAATLQYVVEDVLLKTTRHLIKTTHHKNLCMAGGVFLNCVANQKILDIAEIDNVFIQPGAGDAGGSIGATYFAWNILLKMPRGKPLEHAYLGPVFSTTNIKAAIVKNQQTYIELKESELLDIVTSKIMEGKTVGWHQGRLEFGPRALGNRSILADARNPKMVDILNHRIKHREWFRPFAPIVKEEKVSEYFNMKNFSPFMLLAPEVIEEKRSVIPAVTHIDGTARVQTVSQKTNPLLWNLIDTFETKTGVPVIINTSFNLKGEPIVCTPEEAINDYLKSEMDCLVLGNCFLEKTN